MKAILFLTVLLLRTFRFISVAIVLVCGASLAQSAPEQVNYQGRLIHQDGSSITNRESEFQFSIYSGLTNTTKLWGPQTFKGTNKVMIVDGFFNVFLGPTDDQTNSLSKAFSSPTAFIEIAVIETGAPKTTVFPRQQILSAPYALNSSRFAGNDWGVIEALTARIGHLEATQTLEKASSDRIISEMQERIGQIQAQLAGQEQRVGQFDARLGAVEGKTARWSSDGLQFRWIPGLNMSWQHDGNVVIYRDGSGAIWNTGTINP